MGRGVTFIFSVCVGALAGFAPAKAYAVDPPFETRLVRLSEVLGSLHYLRNLCGETSNRWRDEMETLLQSEKPESDVRARYVAGFNRGYRAFGSSYATCTQSAHAAIDRYMAEGEQLSREIVGRYGN